MTTTTFQRTLTDEQARCLLGDVPAAGPRLAASVEWVLAQVDAQWVDAPAKPMVPVYAVYGQQEADEGLRVGLVKGQCMPLRCSSLQATGPVVTLVMERQQFDILSAVRYHAELEAQMQQTSHECPDPPQYRYA